MINYICLLYYYLIPEKFTKCGSALRISTSDENNINAECDTVESLSKTNDECNIVYGNVIIIQEKIQMLW